MTVEGNRFGRLTRISAKSPDGWISESSDFTPWLADNLDLLSDAIGVSLEFREREYRVGRYYLDLLLEDSRGRVVIVENQFGVADHDHLGKLLTYCAGTGAEVVIWVAETLNEEHRAALEWLNDNTRAEVSFYGLELELLKIGDSAPAPHFRVVIEPNEIVKERPSSPTALTEWTWEAFSAELRIPEGRIAVGRALVELLEAEILRRGAPWATRFRKGYVAFQRPGGYNVFVVDVFWRKTPRFAVKLPAPPHELELVSLYPTLEESWAPSEREWGWTVPDLNQIPDVALAIDLAERLLLP